MAHPHKAEAHASHGAKLGRILGTHSGRDAGMDPEQRADDYGMPAAGPSSSARLKHGGAVHGGAARHRLDRKKRADGGSATAAQSGAVPDPLVEDETAERLGNLASGAKMKRGGMAKRPHHASGGRVKGKGKTTVVVNVMPSAPAGAGPAPVVPPPMPPPMPPPPMGAPPGGPPGGPGAAGGLPPQLLAALAAKAGAGGPPMGAPMMGRKRGGRVMTAGAESGEGRLEKIGKRA